MKLIRLFFLILSIISLISELKINATIVINGDVTDGITTFSFPVQALTTNHDASIAFIGANEPGHNNYAICRLLAHANAVEPIAAEKAHINNTITPIFNPLFNASISKLSFMNQEERLVVVANQMPATIFVIDKIVQPDNIIEFGRPVLDASGTQTSKGIVALACETFTYIFAAVTDFANNPFGQTGSNSGIAVLWRANIITGEGQNTKIGQGILDQLDAQPGTTATPNMRRAALFDGTLPAVKIGDDATILNGSVNLSFSDLLKTLYIGTQAQAGGNPNDGARSVIAATVTNTPTVINNKLIYKPIAPDSAFSTGIDNIIGTIGAGAIVSNFKTAAMITSTNLLYLIVLGGVEGSESTHRTVYALPLVYQPGNDANGTLAKKDAIPVTNFQTEEPHRFAGRAFQDAAIMPADMFTSADPQVQVGNGALNVGDITDLFIKNDAVFAVVPTPDAGYLSGIFYSRALFDSYGRIKGWTVWQRAFGAVNDLIFGGYVPFDTAAGTYLTGTSAATINTIKRTTWGSGNENGMNPLARFVQQTFAIADGGLRGMDEFQALTPSLDGISLLVGTGSKKILIAQTAYSPSGILTPLVGDALAVDPLTFTNGTITNDFPAGSTNAIAISGGALDTLNPIVSSAIGSANNNGWLFVGGIGGLAVLTDENGAGWTTLGNNFAGLRSGMSFKTIGNYSFIRKLMSDNQFLYVLSDSSFDRIDLTASDFADNNLAITTITTAQTLSIKSLLDFVVSDSFALLGTTDGLFKLADDENVQTADTSAQWEFVCLPEGLACIQQISPLSQTTIPQDIARNQGGNIYVLDTDPGKSRAMVHRFSLTVTGTSTEFALLPDQFVQNHPSYFVEFDGIRSWMLPDGDFLYEGHNRNCHHVPTIFIASPRLASGMRLVGNTNPIIYGTTQGEFFAPLLRNSVTGTLLLPTDQGLTSDE